MLVGWVAGRDEEDARQPQMFVHPMSNSQMTLVNGIEAATEQAEAHEAMLNV
jgi:hypothetical protein